MTEKRTEREIIRDAYSVEHRDKIAPVAGYQGGIPWPIHLEAYEAYCKKWRTTQTALIDLPGRGCRGGFGTSELDALIPGWRDRVAAFGQMKSKLAAMDWQPIETAPKGNEDDGPFFDVIWSGTQHQYLPVTRRAINCYRTGNNIKTQHGYPAITTVFNPPPTHWRPAPHDPEQPS